MLYIHHLSHKEVPLVRTESHTDLQVRRNIFRGQFGTLSIQQSNGHIIPQPWVLDQNLQYQAWISSYGALIQPVNRTHNIRSMNAPMHIPCCAGSCNVQNYIRQLVHFPPQQHSTFTFQHYGSSVKEASGQYRLDFSHSCA